MIKNISFSLILFLIINCVSTKQPVMSNTKSVDPVQLIEDRIYSGSGLSDDSPIEALTLAKWDAIRKAVIDYLSADTEKTYQSELRDNLYGTKFMSPFIQSENDKSLSKNTKGQHLYTISLKVNASNLVQRLKELGIEPGMQKSVNNKSDNVEDDAISEQRVQESENIAPDGPADKKMADINPEKKKILDQEIRNLTYMVMFDNNNEIPEDVKNNAVSKINSFLAGQTLNYINQEQLQKLKEEQEIVYSEIQDDMSIYQLLAQELNADMYVLVNAIPSVQELDGKFYASANANIKMFESSTAFGFGEETSRGVRVRHEDKNMAVASAISNCVIRVMPVIIKQSKAYFEKLYKDGIRYDIHFIGAGDIDLMDEYIYRLKKSKDIEMIKIVSQSEEEYHAFIYFWGDTTDLWYVLRRQARNLGLDDFSKKLVRGKQFQIETGI